MIYETSYHSIVRMKERFGINEKQAEGRIKKAIQRGKEAEDFTSWERDFLRSTAYDGCKAIAYDGKCYIVNEDGVCVTVYELPRWFGKKKHYLGKEKIRNYKKYCQNYCALGAEAV